MHGKGAGQGRDACWQLTTAKLVHEGTDSAWELTRANAPTVGKGGDLAGACMDSAMD